MDYISRNLRMARIAARLSQRRLSRETGISQQTISYWEGGKGKPPFEEVIKISKATGISLKMLSSVSMQLELEKRENRRNQP